MNQERFDKELMKNLIDQIGKSDISSISQIVSQLMSIINDPRSGAVDLKNVIEKDPPLTTRLIKLANSAFYNYPRTINNIRDAIVLIGFNAVKELAMSQKVCELFSEDKVIFGYSRPALWKHSVAVALCNKLIFRKVFRQTGENAYVAGLIHDVGIIIVDQFLQDRFENILKSSMEDRINLFVAEENELTFSHTDIATEVAKLWSFPDDLAKAIGKHHQPDDLEDEYKKMGRILFISDYACQNDEIGYSDMPYPNRQQYRQYLSSFKIKEDGIKLIMKEVNEEIAKMEKAGWF